MGLILKDLGKVHEGSKTLRNIYAWATKATLDNHSIWERIGGMYEEV
jgi:hypothetical protein